MLKRKRDWHKKLAIIDMRDHVLQSIQVRGDDTTTDPAHGGGALGTMTVTDYPKNRRGKGVKPESWSGRDDGIPLMGERFMPFFSDGRWREVIQIR